MLGHQAVTSRFAEAMAGGRLHHAWLLHGLKGIGKARLAEHLAARLLCELQKACGNCHACQMLAAGSHPDMHRVSLQEEKRDISIEQVRGLLQFLSLSGAESHRRVVILDDAERLNGQAANALLKGLEEPSAGNLLIIVCADIMRLPATVRSRCLLQHCQPLGDADVRQVLRSLPVPEPYLDLAVDLAKGSPGAVAALVDEKLAAELADWCRLVANMVEADIGKIEGWLQRQVKLVPHDLIVAALLYSLYPVLQQSQQANQFDHYERLHHAVSACARWPGEVVRHSLRPAPALLACLLELRSALRSPA